jgi:hypothetical protein
VFFVFYDDSSTWSRDRSVILRVYFRASRITVCGDRRASSAELNSSVCVIHGVMNDGRWTPTPGVGYRSCAMTREEFEAAYAQRSGITVEALRAIGRVVRPCSCGADECEGWQSVRVDPRDTWPKGSEFPTGDLRYRKSTP